jgi:hypothetical protein
VRDSVELLVRKATPVEVEEYRRFIVNLTHKVAAAHREHGQDVSEPEQAAIDDTVAAPEHDRRIGRLERLSQFISGDTKLRCSAA